MSTLDALLDAIGAAPCLPGARCRSRSHLFDPAAPSEDPEVVAARHAQAIGLCSHCPALDRCRDWYEHLKPSKRPAGVVARQVHQERKAAT
jgi:hypothetical protein